MAKITATARRCKRCGVHAASVPAGGLCSSCSQKWKFIDEQVVSK